MTEKKDDGVVDSLKVGVDKLGVAAKEKVKKNPATAAGAGIGAVAGAVVGLFLGPAGVILGAAAGGAIGAGVGMQVDKKDTPKT